jgi:hypothetical protein
MSYTFVQRSSREVIQLTKEKEIFAASKTRVKAEIAASVISKTAANVARRRSGIVPGDLRAPVCRQEQRGKDAQKSGFASAIRAEKSNRLTYTNFKRDLLKGRYRWFFEWLEKRTPARTGRWKQFCEGFDGDGGLGHGELWRV